MANVRMLMSSVFQAHIPDEIAKFMVPVRIFVLFTDGAHHFMVPVRISGCFTDGAYQNDDVIRVFGSFPG